MLPREYSKVSSHLRLQSKATDNGLSLDVTVSPKSSNFVKLVIPKPVNLSAKLVPLIEPRPSIISVPAEANKFELISQNCQFNGVLNVPNLEHGSQKVDLITLAAAKVVRPPVSLLSTRNSLFTDTKICRQTKCPRIASSKIVRSIRPKETPRLVNKCRLCGNLETKMLDIFAPCGMQKEKIIDKISTLLPFKVEPSDMLPSKICVKCKSKLDSAYDFYVTCVEMDLALKIQLEAEYSENAQKRRYVPLILTDQALFTDKNLPETLKVDPSILRVVDEKLVSVSTIIPENERVAQVVEALKAGLGVEVPILEKTNSAGDAFNLLTTPFNALAPAHFHCCRCNCNLSNSFELLEHELLKFRCSQCQLRFCTSKLRRQHRLKNHQVLRTCTSCNLSFSTRVQLRDHLQLKPFSCACCSLGFHSKTALQLHLVKRMRLLETGSGIGIAEIKSHQSQVCRVQLSSNNQLELHLGSKFKCNECGARYVNKLHLARHIKLKHLSRSIFRCNICQETFNTRMEISTHCLGHKSETVAQFRKQSKGNSIFTLESPFQCNVCGGCKASSSLLKRHLERHKTSSIDKKESKNQVECSICWKKFASATNLKIHIAMTHLRNQKSIKKPKSYLKFKCDICSKMFKVERDMLDHRSAVHLNTLLYSCDFCGSRFSTNANKKVHIFGKKELPFYPCAVCLEAFPSKCQRNLHQQFHEQGSAKEFKCNLCDETFCKLAQLHGHLGKKHPHQVAKSIYCDICGKGFNAKAKFNKHYNSHLLLEKKDSNKNV